MTVADCIYVAPGEEPGNDAEDRFCRWAAGIGYGDLEPGVVAKATELIVDTMGCCLAGMRTDQASALRRLSPPTTGDGAAVVGLPDRYPVAEAARHMAMASHVLEMDDIVASGSVHPGAVVIPAAIAAGSLNGNTNEELIAATVVGYELMTRLAETVQPAAHYRDGLHPTATCGVFGAAAAVAHLLGANAAELRHALGFAATGASGTLSYLNDGAATKPIQVGNVAAYGTAAALLNRWGVRGSNTVFEGRYGFFQAFARQGRADVLADGLEAGPLRILQSGIKPFACCRYVQPGIGLVVDLCAQHGIDADDVAAIRVGVVEPALEIVGEPRERKVRPATAVDVQFSIPFATAIAVQRRRLLPADIDELLDDPATVDLATRIWLVHDPRLDAAYPERWGGWVEITRRDGTVLRADSGDPKGDPGNPMSVEELITKIQDLAGDSASEAVNAARDLLPGGTVPDLIAVLSGGQP